MSARPGPAARTRARPCHSTRRPLPERGRAAAAAAFEAMACHRAPRRYKATIGADFLTKEVTVDDRLVTMQVAAPPPGPSTAPCTPPHAPLPFLHCRRHRLAAAAAAAPPAAASLPPPPPPPPPPY